MPIANYISRRAIVKGALGLASAFAALKIFKSWKSPKISPIIYTSDIHLSVPEGRYAHMTGLFKRFLASWTKEKGNQQWLLFVNGDYIDCAYLNEDTVVAGHEQYQIKETNLFLEIAQRYFTSVMVNFGTGHDFGNIETAEKLTNSIRLGAFKWGQVDLIWFTVFPGSFGSSRALRAEEYERIDKLLAGSKNAILMTHVPFRTKDSFEYGKWSGGTNLTIPMEDPIYPIVGKHSQKVVAIFQGHIHRQYKTELLGIPVFCFPFISSGAYCELEQDDRYVHLSVPNAAEDNERLALN